MRGGGHGLKPGDGGPTHYSRQPETFPATSGTIGDGACTGFSLQARSTPTISRDKGCEMLFHFLSRKT
jgi:hypothetical protein